jgi:transposase
MKKRSHRKGTPSQSQRPHKELPKPALTVVNPNAAGIDVGSTSHYVAVPPNAVPADESAVREFGAFTADLDQLVEWVKACGVTTVAMESTGVYWIPAFQKLETAGIEVVLVNAKRVKHVPGRKTDVADCQWLQQLHTFGLLSGSFRPDDLVCQLRTLMRHRGNLVSEAASCIHRMQKACQEINLHLHHAVSDITGETGLRILRAILAGQRDPAELVKLRDPQITKSTEEEMKKALEGDWRAEHLFVLQQNLDAWEFWHEQMARCDRQVEQVLQKFPTGQPPAADPLYPEIKPEVIPAIDVEAGSKPAAAGLKKKTRQSRKQNDPILDLVPELTRLCGFNLCDAAGFRVLSVLSLISEVGLDMSRWRDDKAFSSWLGVCPNNKISGGRVLSRSTRRVVHRAATTLRLAARGVSNTDSWLGHFYRRMKARLGPAGAITATAHKLACIVYHLLKYKTPYVEIKASAYVERIAKARLGKLKKQAEALGFQLVKMEAPTK